MTNKLDERLGEILDKVYVHGNRKSVEIFDLPKDEMTIANAICHIKQWAKDYALSMLPEKKEIPDDVGDPDYGWSYEVGYNQAIDKTRQNVEEG